MVENNSIMKILDSNLTDAQKEALLGSLADEIMEKQSKKNSFDVKREELIKEERQKAEETRKRLSDYEERGLKEENQRKRNGELGEKIKILSEITNSKGEKIYSDLSSLSRYEIEQLYDMYFEKNKTMDNQKKDEKIIEKNPAIGDNIENSINEDNDANFEENDMTDEDNIEDENEIVDERDGAELTKKEKFKKIAKKALKIGAVVGAVGLVGGAIYHFVNTGDSSQIEDSIKNVADVVQNSASSVPNYDEITSVGNVTEVFSSNQDAIQNINSAPPIDEYFQNKVLGYATSDDQMINASNLGEIIDAHNSGKDITSIYVGNENGIDGFINDVNNQSLTDFLEANKGGKSR